ncbi:MAG: S9 family peptidase, partial [Prevotella sp.]|nr:S9 family peptidase [Prevotella sp.]
MKKLTTICVALSFCASLSFAAEKLSIKAIMGGEFAPQRIAGVNPLAGTDQYATISSDGKRILRYSFKTGAETAVLFDAEQTLGESIK